MLTYLLGILYVTRPVILVGNKIDIRNGEEITNEAFQSGQGLHFHFITPKNQFNFSSQTQSPLHSHLHLYIYISGFFPFEELAPLMREFKEVETCIECSAKDSIVSHLFFCFPYLKILFILMIFIKKDLMFSTERLFFFGGGVVFVFFF